ncbi:MAG: hypothetical protein AAGD14_09290 [Planctomycetota bacterium]
MKSLLALLALVAVGCSEVAPEPESKPEPAAAPEPVLLHYFTLGRQ